MSSDREEIVTPPGTIVLDLGDSKFAAKMMVETLSAAQSLVGNCTFDRDKATYRVAHLQLLINQIEAQTKPARIEEPTPWGVVRACAVGIDLPARAWVRGWADYWFFGEYNEKWEDLIDPVLIRPGIRDESS